MAEKPAEIARQNDDNLIIGAKGGSIAFVLQIASAGLGFLNQIALARILGAGGTGEVILAISVVNISGLLAAFGISGAIIRFIPSYIERKKTAELKGIIYFTLQFCSLLSVVFVVLIILFSKLISINIFHSEGLLKLLPIIALVVPFFTLNDVIGGILRGYKDTLKALLPQRIVSSLFRLIVFLLLSFRGVSSSYAVIAFIAGEVLATVLSIIYLYKAMDKVKPLYHRSEYKEVLTVGATMIFTALSVLLYTQADIWIVGIFATMEDVGIYGLVARLVLLISFSLGAFSTIIPAIITSVYVSGDRIELQRIVSESTRWILTMAMPIVLFLAFESKFILKYMYGEKFIGGYIALIVLSVGQLINAGAGLVGWFLQMTGGHKIFMKITLFWGIINIILNIILVPYFGINGAALSTAFCLSMVNIMSVWVIYNRSSILTLAGGLKFDVVFALVVTILYALLSYKHLPLGHHFLLGTALIIYIGRAIMNGDLPWRYLLMKSKNG